MMAFPGIIGDGHYYYNATWAQENSSGKTINPSRNPFLGRR
jgi:hypothetical protein